MPYFGVHQSIAAGFDAAVYDSSALGYDCVQIFSGNSNRWANRPIAPDAAQKFKDALVKTGQFTPLIHDSYLINLASPEKELHDKSIARFTDELERAQILGVPQVVMHPGAAKDDTKESAIDRVAKSFDQIFASIPDNDVKVLIETTAGQGTYLGGTFEEIAAIIDACDHKDRLCVCLDTCHVFAAGYEIRTKGLRVDVRTVRQYNRSRPALRFPSQRLDEKLGSRADRHDHIGKGEIGLDAFAMLVNDPRFKGMPMYLETPKERLKTASRGTLSI